MIEQFSSVGIPTFKPTKENHASVLEQAVGFVDRMAKVQRDEQKLTKNSIVQPSQLTETFLLFAHIRHLRLTMEERLVGLNQAEAKFSRDMVLAFSDFAKGAKERIDLLIPCAKVFLEGLSVHYDSPPEELPLDSEESFDEEATPQMRVLHFYRKETTALLNSVLVDDCKLVGTTEIEESLRETLEKVYVALLARDDAAFVDSARKWKERNINTTVKHENRATEKQDDRNSRKKLLRKYKKEESRRKKK